jgi:hypothetical protein
MLNSQDMYRWTSCDPPELYGNVRDVNILHFCVIHNQEGHISFIKLNSTPWSESASELYRQSDRRLSAK